MDNFRNLLIMLAAGICTQGKNNFRILFECIDLLSYLGNFILLACEQSLNKKEITIAVAYLIMNAWLQLYILPKQLVNDVMKR